MGSNDYVLDLETDIAIWKSYRASDEPIKFDVQLYGRIEIIQMKGLAWSVEARRMPNSRDYTFNVIDVNPPESLRHLSPKLKLLVAALQAHIRDLFSVEELLDKLYACSCFLSRADDEKRWWIIADAEIMAVTGMIAKQATKQAAEAAAGLFVELVQSLAFIPRPSVMITEEAVGFSGKEKAWNGVAQAAVNGGDVLQWCKVRGLERTTFPCFEFEIAVQDFLQGNGEICQIGLVNNRALKVSVCLGEQITVVCSQEGVEPETSVGLNSVLPYIVRNYIKSALDEGGDGVENVVEGLLQRVVGYLVFAPRVCEVCGSHSSGGRSCSNICEARKNVCGGSLPKLTWPTDDGLWRREGNERNLEAARVGLSGLAITDDVSMG